MRYSVHGAGQILRENRSARVMKKTSILLCIIFYMCLPASCVKTVGLQETVTLPCNTTCLGTRKWTLGDDLVIECDKRGQCHVGMGFENRVKLSNESINGKYPLDLTISGIYYNEQGAFTGSCDDIIPYCYHNVEVLVPQNVTVSPGDDAALPCYAVTGKEVQKVYVSWERNGEKILQLNKTFSYGSIPKERVSVSEDGLKKGDFSLHLTDVHPSDQGVYQCHYSERREADKFRGAPNAIRLIVQVPLNVTASPGDNATLPCYADTEKGYQYPYVSWERNGEKILQLDNKTFSYGSIPKERVSVSEDGLKKGDYSLHLTNVCPSDQGVYQCHYSERRETEKFRGAPNAIRLIVQAPQCETGTLIKVIVILVIIAIIAIGLVIVLGILLVWKKCNTTQVPLPSTVPESNNNGAVADVPAEPLRARIPDEPEPESFPLIKTGNGIESDCRYKETV